MSSRTCPSSLVTVEDELFRSYDAHKCRKHCCSGENKKRFVDLERNFDLDLVYVSPTLIAMSVPAVGKLSMYRNPLKEVAPRQRASEW